MRLQLVAEGRQEDVAVVGDTGRNDAENVNIGVGNAHVHSVGTRGEDLGADLFGVGLRPILRIVQGLETILVEEIFFFLNLNLKCAATPLPGHRIWR